MTKASSSTGKPSRMYVKGTFIGFKRGRRNTYHKTSLLKIDGVEDVKASEFYFGKKIAYVYKAKTAVAGSKYRVIWGKVMRAHGSNGVVRAKFASNLNPEWVGSGVRVMLYPSRV